MNNIILIEVLLNKEGIYRNVNNQLLEMLENCERKKEFYCLLDRLCCIIEEVSKND